MRRNKTIKPGAAPAALTINTAPGVFPVPSKIYKTMTQKKKYLTIAAACILSGVWFNHDEATGLEYAAALASVAGAAAACYMLHRETMKEETPKTPTPNK